MPSLRHAANFPSNIVGFRGFDSSIILIIRGSILVPIGDFPESLSRAVLVGIMLLGRFGVSGHARPTSPPGGADARGRDRAGR